VRSAWGRQGGTRRPPRRSRRSVQHLHAGQRRFIRVLPTAHIHSPLVRGTGCTHPWGGQRCQVSPSPQRRIKHFYVPDNFDPAAALCLLAPALAAPPPFSTTGCVVPAAVCGRHWGEEVLSLDSASYSVQSSAHHRAGKPVPVRVWCGDVRAGE
jgi:hypothetical protein